MRYAICIRDGCEAEERLVRGLCSKHYMAARRTGDLPPKTTRHELTRVKLEARTAVCSICGPTHINVEPMSDGRIRRRCPGERRIRNQITSEQRRATHLRRKYDISASDYDAMVAAQDGRCAVCGKSEPFLHVDHDHDTGKVRGLLCGHCNRGLGLFGDDARKLRSAIKYLSRARSSSL